MNVKTKGILRIGTSGIVVPGGKSTFPLEFQSKSRLSYFSHLFNTVEVNSTFRKIPRHSTFEKWCAEVPLHFQFTLKLLKDFTHVKKLETAFDNIDNFLEAADLHTGKKGCLLIQFPASITAQFRERVQLLLQTLHELDAENKWRKAVEFRSETWYTSETYNMLNHYNACMVLHDMPKASSLHVSYPFSFFYYRYHGPQGDYRGSYSYAFLKEQAASIDHLLSTGKDVYVYFNNTMGSAFENARYLKDLLQEGR